MMRILSTACRSTGRWVTITTVRRRRRQLGERLGEREVAIAVEVGVGLIEHQQSRIAVHSAGEPDALALALRQPVAGRRDVCLIATGQAQDQLVHSGKLSRCDELVAVDGVEAGNVLADGAGEQFDLLRQVAEVAAEIVEVPGEDIGAVDAHVAKAWARGPDEEAAKRRLAGAGRSDNGATRARLEAEADIGEDRLMRGPAQA